MQSLSIQGPWRKYKRFSDSVKLEARLVEVQGEKFLQIRQVGGKEFRCPACQEVLTEVGAENFPATFLRPKTFHEKFKPIDPD